MVLLHRVGSIGYIHGQNCLLLYSASTFTENVKAYNPFVLIDSYELGKAHSNINVVNVNKILDISKIFGVCQVFERNTSDCGVLSGVVVRVSGLKRVRSLT